MGKKTEVEVTPEMIAAGLRTLWASGIVEYETESNAPVVVRIYKEMARAQSLADAGPRREDAP